jgi:carboxylesterase
MSVLPGAEPFVLDAGPGAPAGVVLCHGFTGTPQSIRPWGEALHTAGYTVVCPLLPGHGTRWQDMNKTGWQDWYGALETAFTELRALLDGPDVPIVAGGLSMGGTLVTRLAEVHGPDLAGLLLVNPSYLTLRRDAKLLPLVSKLIPSFPGISNDIKKPGAQELAYGKLPLRAAASLNELWKIVRADLGSVKIPVRLFRSAVDHVVEPENGAALLAALGSGDVTEVVLPDSYHVATLDNDAETIFTGSVTFVQEIVTGAPVAGDPARRPPT